MNKSVISLLFVLMTPYLLGSPGLPKAAVSVCQSSVWTVDRINDEVRIFHKVGNQFPQYAALHLNDGYFRLNYGSGSGWGPSVILMPTFWSGGQHRQYTGPALNLSCSFVDTLLVLTLKGTHFGLNATINVRLNHPTSTSISAQVTASVAGRVPIDTRPGEAFKPVTLSSMRISATQWDSKKACAGTQCFSIPASGWIIPPTQGVAATDFRLIGGTSTWKINSPTVVIKDLNALRRITGWVTSTQDPNKDNIGFWASSKTLLPSWSYTIVARRP